MDNFFGYVIFHSIHLGCIVEFRRRSSLEFHVKRSPGWGPPISTMHELLSKTCLKVNPQELHRVITFDYHILRVNPKYLQFFPKAAAKGSFEKSVAIKDCHQSSAEVMAVFKDCNQTLPKVLLE